MDPVSGPHDGGYQANGPQLFDGGADVLGDCGMELNPLTRLVLDLRLIAVTLELHLVDLAPDEAMGPRKAVAPDVAAAMAVTEDQGWPPLGQRGGW